MVAVKLAIPITQLFNISPGLGLHINNPTHIGGIIFCLQDLLEGRSD